jgi:hypothetical protein
LLQSLGERMRSRSGLSVPGLLGGVRWLRLSKKLRRIPEVHVESLDLFDEHEDGAAGRSDLFARVVRQALTPAVERLEFLLIEDCVARCIRQGSPKGSRLSAARYEIRRC